MANPVKVVQLEDLDPISWGGGESARFLLRAADTGGQFSLYEVLLPAGEGSLYHVHSDTDETFLVFAGELEFKVGDELHKVGPGGLVFGPRGIGHSFFNTGDEPSRMLCVMTPGGIETFFEQLSELLSEPAPPDWERMRELAARHRIVAFRPLGGPHGGPPLAAAG